MKCIKILCLLIFIAGDLVANVSHISIQKVSTDPALLEVFRFVQENQRFYDHWTPKWNYDVDKKALENKLTEAYRSFYGMRPKNEETFLLLGDIAHYLYNLDVTLYGDSAINNYRIAMVISPEDFRTDWFLAFHYSLSNVPSKAIDYFLLAQSKLPPSPPADFWEEYAWATFIANMPSHAIFAMDQIRSLTGKAGNFETKLGKTALAAIVDIDKDSAYRKKDIWSMQTGRRNTFTSRPLGLKLSLDSSWRQIAYDYTKHTNGFIIKPPMVKNKTGREIGYTIALLMKVADDKDQLENYLEGFVSKFTDKKRISFSDKYDNIIAYEMKDMTMYPDIGGGHLYLIGIERMMPKYPGLLLEEPLSIPDDKSATVSYYKASHHRNRFKGKIFYALMLDTCEDIHEVSLSSFKKVFETQLILE